MGRRASKEFDADVLLREYKVYDQAVDVVSCHHWLFTEVDGLAETVEHFERYPRVKVATKEVTPDFTVLFTDASGLAGEVARIALHENSVDSLCDQIARYADLPELPTHSNQAASRPDPKGPVDVLVLTPVETIKDAARRILTERMDNDEHPFSPTRRPVLVQFSQSGDDYVFLRWSSPNGELHRGHRETVYGDIDPFKCSPDRFGPNKVRYGFMNDPVPPLYMATRLWATVLPNRFWSDEEVTIPVADLVAAVRDVSEGFGKADDVRRGMRVLVAAGLARETVKDKEWKVARQSLKRTGPDVAIAIAERIRKANSAQPPSARIVTGRRPRRAKQQVEGQAPLF